MIEKQGYAISSAISIVLYINVLQSIHSIKFNYIRSNCNSITENKSNPLLYFFKGKVIKLL